MPQNSISASIHVKRNVCLWSMGGPIWRYCLEQLRTLGGPKGEHKMYGIKWVTENCVHAFSAFTTSMWLIARHLFPVDKYIHLWIFTTLSIKTYSSLFAMLGTVILVNPITSVEKERRCSILPPVVHCSSICMLKETCSNVIKWKLSCLRIQTHEDNVQSV